MDKRKAILIGLVLVCLGLIVLFGMIFFPAKRSTISDDLAWHDLRAFSTALEITATENKDFVLTAYRSKTHTPETLLPARKEIEQFLRTIREASTRPWEYYVASESVGKRFNTLPSDAWLIKIDFPQGKELPIRGLKKDGTIVVQPVP